MKKLSRTSVPGSPKNKKKRGSKKGKVLTREDDATNEDNAPAAANCTVATCEDNADDVDLSNARKRNLTKIEQVLEKFVQTIAQKKIEGLKAEFASLGSFQPVDPTATAFSLNKDKNRYHNIPCLERTRVHLTFQVPPETDYIHANWATIPEAMVKLGNRYICCQAPTETTVNDYWRMIWQEKPKHIIMLCRTLEAGKPKCAQYWPLTVGEQKQYGPLIVQNARCATGEKEKVFESSIFNVSMGSDTFQLTQHRWVDWPDFGVPASGMGVLRLLRLVRDSKDCTAIIHCSAGVGRTGTVLAVEVALRVLLEGREVNVLDVVKELRNSRHGSVQTESQYLFLHRSIVEYIFAKKLAKNECVEFTAAYQEYMKNDRKPGPASPSPTPSPGVGPAPAAPDVCPVAPPPPIPPK